jgi:predicted Fe-Mo cluster-binding NifX family protein
MIMKICFPVKCNDGMESKVFDHFGSAPMFLMVDAKTGEIHEQVNQDKGHGHGQCQPLKALAGQTVDAIVVGGIGKGALNGLHRAGLKVFQAQAGSVAYNLSQITEGTLNELTINDVCGGHAGGHDHGSGSTHGAGCGC